MKLNIIIMGIVIILAIGILFGGHFLVYFSLIKFLRISSVHARLWIGISLFVLGTSFIISSILSHFSENAFTRSLYYYSSLWLGVLTNLAMFFALAWAVYWVIRIFDAQGDYPRYIGIMALVLSAAVSIYGGWNAYNQQIKYITVKIKDLPAEWQGKTVVQISDVHIGHVFDERFLEKVVGMINSVKPEAVFITGDLFDGMDGSYDMRMAPLNEIEAPKGIYFVTGNHETYFGLDKVKAILTKTNVKVLDDMMANVAGLQIIGASYPQRGEARDIAGFLAKLSGFNKNQPSILLYHSPTHIDEAKNAGISLQLSGHTHRGQIWPYNFITHLVYKGYDYGLFQDGDFTLYTTNGTGAWGPTMRTGNTPEIVAIKLEKK